LFTIDIMGLATDIARMEHQGEPSARYVPVVARPRRLLPSQVADRWPDRESDDPAVEVARRLANALRTAMGGRSLRAIGDATGVDHTTVAAILNGTTWPDLSTIARLEAGLDVDLWPHGVARSSSRAGPTK